MEKQTVNNVKLGVFVLAGLTFLILLLYMIGKNRSFFGSHFVLKARFENVQGLKTGNNVRYAGIEVGTVDAIRILNDTSLEVSMIIDENVKGTIHKNAIAAIGTDGLVGNKVVNISGSKEPAPEVQNGDILPTKKPVDTDEMLRTLYSTNNDVAIIAEKLKITINNVNNSKALWKLLDDKGMAANFKASAANIRAVTEKAKDIVQDINTLTTDLRIGKGSLGQLLTDTAFVSNLNGAVNSIKTIGIIADSLSMRINKTIQGIDNEVQNGKGIFHLLLKDTSLVNKFNASIENIREGTEGFNQNMEALKHNFLFSGYFKKLERERLKEAKKKP